MFLLLQTIFFLYLCQMLFNWQALVLIVTQHLVMKSMTQRSCLNEPMLGEQDEQDKHWN